MEMKDVVVKALSALADGTRLAAFRLLVRMEPGGIAAGDLAGRLSVSAKALSNHLAILSDAGLVTVKQRGRAVVYRASLSSFHPLVLFLLQDCCLGHPEQCNLTQALATPLPGMRPRARKSKTRTGMAKQ